MQTGGIVWIESRVVVRHDRGRAGLQRACQSDRSSTERTLGVEVTPLIVNLVFRRGARMRREIEADARRGPSNYRGVPRISLIVYRRRSVGASVDRNLQGIWRLTRRSEARCNREGYRCSGSRGIEWG